MTEAGISAVNGEDLILVYPSKTRMPHSALGGLTPIPRYPMTEQRRICSAKVPVRWTMTDGRMLGRMCLMTSLRPFTHRALAASM